MASKLRLVARRFSHHNFNMSNIPDVQNAWVVVKQGKPRDALELKTDWPVPKKLDEGEVLVKVQASALNPV